VVVGSGSLDAQVREAAARGAGAVEVRGAVSDEELHRLYASAAVVLMPSRYEGLGMVALEAAAAGAVVVAADVTGLRDAVAGRGILVPPGDLEGMARATAELLAEPARRADVAGHSRREVGGTFAWASCAEAVQALYRLVTSPH
jgi:glycosyltransferase involved in cell wall biosynthesis